MGAKRARCGPMDRIVRLLTLSWIHTMRMDGLRTCVTPPEPSDWIKSSVIGTIFGRIFCHFKNRFREFSAKIGNVKVFLVSRDLK